MSKLEFFECFARVFSISLGCSEKEGDVALHMTFYAMDRGGCREYESDWCEVVDKVCEVIGETSVSYERL